MIKYKRIMVLDGVSLNAEYGAASIVTLSPNTDPYVHHYAPIPSTQPQPLPLLLHKKRRRSSCHHRSPKTRAIKRRRLTLPNRTCPPQPVPRHGVLSPTPRHHSFPSPPKPNTPPPPTLFQSCPCLFPLFPIFTLQLQQPSSLHLRLLLQSHHRHSLQSPPIRRRLATHRPNGPKQHHPHFIRFLDLNPQINRRWPHPSGDSSI